MKSLWISDLEGCPRPGSFVCREHLVVITSNGLVYKIDLKSGAIIDGPLKIADRTGHASCFEKLGIIIVQVVASKKRKLLSIDINTLSSSELFMPVENDDFAFFDAFSIAPNGFSLLVYKRGLLANQREFRLYVIDGLKRVVGALDFGKDFSNAIVDRDQNVCVLRKSGVLEVRSADSFKLIQNIVPPPGCEAGSGLLDLKDVYVVDYHPKTIVEYGKRSCEKMGTHEYSKEYPRTNQFVIGNYFFSTQFGVINCFQTDSLRLVYSVNVGVEDCDNNFQGLPAVHGSVFFLPSNNYHLYSIETATGHVSDRMRFDSFPVGTPQIIKDKLVLNLVDNKIAMIEIVPS